MKKCKRYLENVVFHVTDLNLFLQVPVWAEGSQQRLESEKKPCVCQTLRVLPCVAPCSETHLSEAVTNKTLWP